MKLRTFVPILTFAAASLVLAGSLQQTYLLRLNLAPNSSDKYKIDMVSNQVINAPGAPPNVDVKGTMDLEVATGAVKDGLADVELKTTNMNIDAGEMGAAMGMQEIPKEIVTKAKLDDRYRVTQAVTTGLGPQQQMMMGMTGSNTSQLFMELPEKPIKLGDTWQVRMAKNPMLGEKDHMLNATLVSLKDYDGVPVYEISLRGTIDFDVDMAQAMKAMAGAAGAAAGGGTGGQGGTPPPDLGGLEMRMKGNIKVTGSTLISRNDGKMQFSLTKMEAKQVLNVMGMDIDIAGTTTINVKKAK